MSDDKVRCTEVEGLEAGRGLTNFKTKVNMIIETRNYCQSEELTITEGGTDMTEE